MSRQHRTRVGLRSHAVKGTGLFGLLVVLALGSISLSGCSPALVDPAPGPTKPLARGPVEMRVSAATSLMEVLEAAAPEYESANDVKLVFNFGPSGVLQKQIEAGAPADVFISASPSQVESLVAQGAIRADAATSVAGNDLVIFVLSDNPAGIKGPDDLKRAARLVTGNPRTAPHGTKAREWLQGLGVWSGLQPRFVFAENAAQTMDYVARGEVDAGIGFASEAENASGVDVVYTVPSTEITPIRYVAAPLVDAQQAKLASAYIAHLLGASFQQTLVESGFRPADDR